jgi:formylglycine-generating enzyme required for sulfatase activity
VAPENQPPEFVLRLTLSLTESMPWDWPAEVNCLEANAYCRWLTKTTGITTRLPTEDEYYLMLK